MFFFSIAIVVKSLYSRPVVTETRGSEARSGKRYRRPHFYPFPEVQNLSSLPIYVPSLCETEQRRFVDADFSLTLCSHSLYIRLQLNAVCWYIR